MARLQTGSSAFVILSLACTLAFEAGRDTMLVAAQDVKPLQVQDTNTPSLVAEFIECKRSEGVLTVQVRLRNTGTARVDLNVIFNGNFDQFYVTADTKKYLMLRDSDKTPLAVAANASGHLPVSIAGGARWTFWAKYPAPPATVKKINFFSPLGPPFDDVPISDR